MRAQVPTLRQCMSTSRSEIQTASLKPGPYKWFLFKGEQVVYSANAIYLRRAQLHISKIHKDINSALRA
jgi:hypothetical protein